MFVYCSILLYCFRFNKLIWLLYFQTLRDINYIVIYRNFMENILGVEFRVPIDNGYFYRGNILITLIYFRLIDLV
jgi:hypothetical protein